MSEDENTPQHNSENVKQHFPELAKADIKPTVTENMETHAQHLHKAPGKKWTHYLFEFLMLFLAVFCGFLAENIREESVERHRENQFIQSFIEDLRTDTASIRQIMTFRKQKMERMDSLMFLLSSQKIKGFENDLYFFGRTLIRTLWFRSNDRTITQLKNSGSLRLIRNIQAADSMMSYQQLVETIMLNQEDDRVERIGTGPFLSQIFDPFVFDKMVAANGVNRIENNPPLRSYDPKLQQDLAYYVHQLKGSNFIIEGRLEQLNDKAKSMIAFLQKEYHLE